MHKLIQILAAGIAMAAQPHMAFAEMGRAPLTGAGTYGSVDGGFGLQSGTGTTTYGVSGDGANFSDQRLGADRGWFIGGMLGVKVDGVIVGPFNRIEGFVTFLSSSDSGADTVPPFASIGIVSADGKVQVVGGSEGVARTDRTTVEGGVRLLYDQLLSNGDSYTWALTPFIRHIDETTDVTVIGCCTANLHGDADNTMYGILVTFEPEWRLAGNLTLVARLGAGIYGYRASGRFYSSSTGLLVPDPLAASVSDEQDGVGFRGQLGLALKYWILPNANVEPFAEADYFSHFGRVSLANFGQPDVASRISTDDLWELRAGIRINLGLQ